MSDGVPPPDPAVPPVTAAHAPFVPPPIPAAGPPQPLDPETVQIAQIAEMANGYVSRLGTYARGAGAVARFVTFLVSGTGLVALLVGVAAWRHRPVVAVIVAVLCLPAILAPLRALRRTRAMVAAVSQPREMAAQARDLGTGLIGAPELDELHDLARRGDLSVEGDGTGSPLRKLRTFGKVTKLTTTLVGRARPDEDRHPHLVPFTPERLAGTWSAITTSLWGWLLAVVVLVVSIPVLAASLV